MGFFDRLMGNNSQPQDLTRKGFSDVIENKSDPSFLIWHHPNESFNNNTRLIVNEKETALFIDGGKIVGKYDIATDSRGILLRTSNYPGVRAIAELFTAGRSQFPCKVVFIRQNRSKLSFQGGWPIGPQIIDSFDGYIENLSVNYTFKYYVSDPEALYKEAGEGNSTREEIASILSAIINPALQSLLKQILEQRGRNPRKWISEITNVHNVEFRNEIIRAINNHESLKTFGLELFDLPFVPSLNSQGLNEDYIAKNKAITDLKIKLSQGEHWSEIQKDGILKFVAKNPASQANTMLSTIMGVDASKILFPMGGGASQPWDSPLGFGDSMSPINSGQNTAKPVGFVALEEEMVKEQMETLREKMKMYKSDLEIGIITQTDYDELIEEIRKEYKRLQK